jgi:hypothetical protein
MTDLDQKIVQQTAEDLARIARITNANAESVRSEQAEKLRRVALELGRICLELEAA